MKEYDNKEYCIEYHVIEYDIDDVNYGNIITKIFKCMLAYKYLKIIDKTHNKINYYKDNMKHNDYGPSVISDSNSFSYYIEDKKISEYEFKNNKRTKLIEDMLNDIYQK